MSEPFTTLANPSVSLESSQRGEIKPGSQGKNGLCLIGSLFGKCSSIFVGIATAREPWKPEDSKLEQLQES